MNWFENLVYLCQYRKTEPAPFGSFHIMCLIFLVLAIVLFSFVAMKCKEKTFRITLLVFWVVLVSLQVFREFVSAFHLENDVVSWQFDWGNLPFQLCSMILYVLPVVIFFKDGKFRDAAMAFLCTFSLFGGLSSIYYPDTIFTANVYGNFQTVFHHSSQVVVGVFVAVYNRDKLNLKFFLRGVIVFLTLTLTAIILNVVIHFYGNYTPTFFFISPFEKPGVMLIKDLYDVLPYNILVSLYILIFTLIASVIYLYNIFWVKFLKNIIK